MAVLDWDAHHGNGTQAAFWGDPAVLYVSLHQFPLYPGTGAASERGGGEGAGATVNIPLAPGTGGDEYLEAFRTRALPALRDFDPGLLLVSAGFDAHRADPLTDLGLEAEAFATMTRELHGIGAGPVMVLEGGYDLTALRDSTAAVLTALRRIAGAGHCNKSATTSTPAPTGAVPVTIGRGYASSSRSRPGGARSSRAPRTAGPHACCRSP